LRAVAADVADDLAHVRIVIVGQSGLRLAEDGDDPAAAGMPDAFAAVLAVLALPGDGAAFLRLEARP
jgi:hypothetical protein